MLLGLYRGAEGDGEHSKTLSIMNLPSTLATIQLLDICLRCHAWMGPLRPYKGMGSPEKRVNQGRLCQTVSFAFTSLINPADC
jgi:hypothetical protein